DLVAQASQLDRPLEVHATFARLDTMLAESNRRLGKTDEQRKWETQAETEIDALAAAAAPNDADAFRQEGIARFFLGDCTGAIAALQKVQAIEPDNVDAANDIGIIAVKQDRIDLAIASSNRALALRPNDAVALENLSALSVLQGLADGRFIESIYLLRGED